MHATLDVGGSSIADALSSTVRVATRGTYAKKLFIFLYK